MTVCLILLIFIDFCKDAVIPKFILTECDSLEVPKHSELILIFGRVQFLVKTNYIFADNKLRGIFVTEPNLGLLTQSAAKPNLLMLGGAEGKCCTYYRPQARRIGRS